MMSRDAEALLAKGRASPPRPDEASRARMRERVLARAGAAALAGATVASVAKASPPVVATAGKIGLVWKLVAVLVLGGGLVSGVSLLGRATEPAPRAPTAEPAPALTPPREQSSAAAASSEGVDPAPQATARIAEAPSPVPSAEAARPGASAVPAPSSARPSPERRDLLEEELALLASAQTALRSGQAAQALALTDEHAKRFPKGMLGSERRLIRIRALCASGRKEQGLAEGRAAFPDEASPGRQQLEAACR